MSRLREARSHQAEVRRTPFTLLSQKRLQERAGRWLKLVSGLVLGALGAVLVFRPEWLRWASARA